MQLASSGTGVHGAGSDGVGSRAIKGEYYEGDGVAPELQGLCGAVLFTRVGPALAVYLFRCQSG